MTFFIVLALFWLVGCALMGVGAIAYTIDAVAKGLGKRK